MIGHNGGPPLVPRWYQEEAVESLFDFFDKHGGTDPATGMPVKANPIIAMPTGTGKSIVIAEFFKRALMRYPATRGLMSTHVKELIRQNAAKMQEVWPHAPLGIHSAGIGQRDTVQPIIFGGIKSMVGKFPLFGFRDFLVIDEGHLVSPKSDTSYVNFIFELMYGPDVVYDPDKPVTKQQFDRAVLNPRCNPYLKVIMLTASPYRMGLGHLTNGNIATHTAFDLCNIEGFNRLIAEGYLCPLIPKRTNTEFDLSAVPMSQGDFQQAALEAAVDKDEITFACLKELVEHSWNRRCGLIFASGVKHAVHINDMMNSVFGQECVVIHSSTPDYKRTDKENDEALKAWKSGKVKWAVNMNSLTTGVDNPAVDIIGMMRGTMSTGLWVQMLGRGTRPFYAPGYDLSDFNQRWSAIYAGGKANCLVLDFAGNTRKLGPINDPVIPKPKGKGAPGDAPVRICKNCGTYNHASVRACVVCGTEFEFGPALSRSAGTDELLRSDLPQVEPFKVDRVLYQSYTTKATGRNMIRVSYYCQPLRTFYELITVEGKEAGKLDYAAKKGRDWFRQRYPSEPPETNAEVLKLMSELRPPAKVNVWLNKKYPEVLSYEFA